MVDLGIHQIGKTNVQVYGDPDIFGGRFDWKPDDEGLPCMKIGLASPRWDDTVSVFLHELFEMLFIQRNASYKESSSWNRSSSQYLFVFDHEDFNDSCEYAGTAVVDILPRLASAHKNRHTKKKKRRR